MSQSSTPSGATSGAALHLHPLTRAGFTSPVPPGSGWPGDPADLLTAVAHSRDDVVALASTASPGELDARVSVCRACPRLVAWREAVATGKRRSFADQPYWGRPVTGWGDWQAGVLVVGLAPAAHGGNRTGRVFTGDRSGDWIFAALHRAGVAASGVSVHAGDAQHLRGVRIAAPVRCAPPDNAPSVRERDACEPWFDREVSLVAPRVLLALGGFAWTACLGVAGRLGWAVPRPRPRFGHGAHVVLQPGASSATGVADGGPLHVVASYHVSQQNTSTGRLTRQMLDDVVGRAIALAA